MIEKDRDRAMVDDVKSSTREAELGRQYHRLFLESRSLEQLEMPAFHVTK